MPEENSLEEPKILSKHDFYFETSLYEVVDLLELERNSFIGDVDAYSSKNSSETHTVLI